MEILTESPSKRRLYRPCSLSGHELDGDNLSRFIYLDESGISSKEAVLVVAGVIINPDLQWLAVRRHIDDLIDEYVPKEHQDGFVFHATDLFHGSGKVFDRRKYDIKRAHEALMFLLRAPDYFDLPVIFGMVRKLDDIKDLTRKQQRGIIARNHSLAFAYGVTAAERYMHEYADRREIATLAVENNDETQRALKNMLGILRGKNMHILGAPEFYKHVSNISDCLPLTRIVDSISWQFKDEAVLLQIADACAFITRRYFEDKTTPDKFFASLAGSNFTKSFGSKDSLSCGRMFAWGKHKRHTASVAEQDANQQALEQVEKATDSERDKGEDLLKSEDLKRQLREAKERLESSKPPRK